MTTTPFRVEATRGDRCESLHAVEVAVVDSEGRLVASSGDPDLVTFWRSAAKPFQALPLVADGAADRFNLGADAIALACGSHSSEPKHVALALRMLAAIGCQESDLACGPHTPLSPAVHEAALRAGTALTPAWSNCSGKHAGMLALARHHAWPTAGYERAGHPAQARILAEVCRWTGLDPSGIVQAVDGCTTVCFGLPLREMALAYARFGVSREPAAVRVREAMVEHPELIGGTGRLCTDLIRQSRGGVIAKVGAEGVYCAAVPGRGLGIALKVADGDMRSSQVALLGVLARLDQGGDLMPTVAALPKYAEPILRNTRREETGVLRAAGSLRIHAPAGGRSVPTGESHGVS
jgi:L-asparaginase II